MLCGPDVFTDASLSIRYFGFQDIEMRDAHRKLGDLPVLPVNVL